MAAGETQPQMTPESAAPEYLLEAHNIVKVFGTLAANDDVSLMVRPGEIHALLGENGAGKSTLVKIIYGALQPNAGELRWLGRPVRIDNPAAARRLGIGMVFQHFSLFEALTVAENIALGLPGAFNMASCRSASSRSRPNTACRSTPTNWCSTSRSASASASRSCAACCRSRGCSSWTSRPRCSRPRRPTSSSSRSTG
jgi:ABC-type sugar transport system ATPase subunit